MTISGARAGSGPESCTDCQAGPRGIAGHDHLYSHSMTSNELQFTCRECGRFWARPLTWEGRSVWREISDVTGHDVPGRPGTTPP